jgi:hypothetical protein
LTHLLASWFYLLILNTACQEGRAVLISHVFVDEEGEYLSVLYTNISNIFVVRIEITIIYLNGGEYLTSRRNLV